MKSAALALAAAGMVLAFASPALAWHGHGGVYFGFWGPPVYYYPPPPPAYYYPPPAVVYEEPPAVVFAPSSPSVNADPAGPIYRDSTSGLYCREYQSTVMIAGQPRTSYGTACQQPDGTWRIVR